MNVHILQHVSFEGPGHIDDWALQNGHSVSVTRLFSAPDFPPLNNLDMLIVLGGPMNIYEESKYIWLPDEKRFIKAFIDSGKPVLGICLGSQLIADVLGAKVVRNKEMEIGWMPVTKTFAAKCHPLFHDLEFDSPVFHWHGDTFELPEGARNLFESAGCKNQMFAYADNVLGIQFHPEATPETVRQMVRHGRNELEPAIFVQSETEILKTHFSGPNQVLSKILDRISQRAQFVKSRQ